MLGLEARVTAQVFADEELERLQGFPEIGRDELFRFFTLTRRMSVSSISGRVGVRRTGWARRSRCARCRGWIRAGQGVHCAAGSGGPAGRPLEGRPGELRSYGKRAKIRTEHRRLVAQYLGWRPASTLEFKELDEFLLARAMEHDSLTLLFRLACEYLISGRVIRPGTGDRGEAGRACP